MALRGRVVRTVGCSQVDLERREGVVGAVAVQEGWYSVVEEEVVVKVEDLRVLEVLSVVHLKSETWLGSLQLHG